MSGNVERYDVAVSCAGEDRQVADAIVAELRRRGVGVFYYLEERAALWGRNLRSLTYDVYANRARYCLVLLSRSYLQKRWTNHELQAAQDRAFRDAHDYILPLIVDGCEPPDSLALSAYLVWGEETPAGIADLIQRKLAVQPEVRAEPAAEPKPPPAGRVSFASLAPAYFEPFDEYDSALDPPADLPERYRSIWTPSRDEIWDATITAGAFRLLNAVDSNAVRYIHLRLQDGDMGESAATVDVHVAPRSDRALAAAGLLYRFDRERRHYLGFLVGVQRYAFIRRDERGFRIEISKESPSIKPGEYNQLGIQSVGREVHLFLNETHIETIDGGEPHGDLGVAAGGRGLFRFDNFTVYR